MGEMEINDCWSLLAVVRECTRKVEIRNLEADTLSTAAPYTTATAALETTTIAGNSLNYNSLGPIDELRDLYRPFLLSTATTTMAAGNTINTINNPEIQFDQLLQRPSRVDHQCIHKKKRLEERRVCRLSVEELPSDKWAWRKYGQKPIKGSPYPRNYYRCSSSKGCTARKQVERSPSDPNTYIVTYTGHHHHARPTLRSSGGFRVKYSGYNPPELPISPEGESPTSSIAVTTMASEQIGARDILKIEDDDVKDDDYEILIPNLVAESELLMGMEQLMMESGKRTNNGFGLEVEEMDEYSPATVSAAAAAAVAHESANKWGCDVWDN